LGRVWRVPELRRVPAARLLRNRDHPEVFIIAIWGSTRKEYGAMKLALYSFVGTRDVLVGFDCGVCRRERDRR